MSAKQMILTNANGEFLNSEDIESAFLGSLIKLMVSCPMTIISVAMAYLSGHLWVYMIVSYCSKKERKVLESLVGKLGLGLGWFAVILILVFLITNHHLNITVEYITKSIVSILVLSLALQVLIIAIVNVYNRKG